MSDPKNTSREEDFRDYEARDIRDGWPYSDSDGEWRLRRNAPYGGPGANLDRLDDKGVDVSTDPALRPVEGAPVPFSDGTEETIEDDDLEERITQRLEDDPRFDLDSIEITLRDGVAHVEGAVDSEAERRHLVALIRSVAGVRDVRAEGLLARGVDSHIPRDADE